MPGLLWVHILVDRISRWTMKIIIVHYASLHNIAKRQTFDGIGILHSNRKPNVPIYSIIP